MRQAVQRTLDLPLSPAAPNTLTPDPSTLRLRWRLIIRPARSLSEAAGLRINQATRATEQNLLRRWRPMSAPSNPVPPWRWPGHARAERASRRAAVGERWRPLTAR
ncbi:MAG TPA: hypothetical protein VKT82_28645 [Ktedonobacterales bacterium]|nr:hypothetical protein [Ktedonobacterales bacterium]